jgi:hypothetical protein
MKLTAAEAKWIDDVNALLAKCPSKRLGFYTIGDRDVYVYDFTKEKKIEELMERKQSMDYPTAVNELDAGVGALVFPNNVHSVSG